LQETGTCQFAIIAYDLLGDEARMRRLDARAEHMKGTRQLKIEGRILDSGGLLDDSGRMSSSAVLCDFPDCTALDAYLASEPYIRRQVWSDVKILDSRASTGMRCS
jgi:uncharacterized protein YciI